MNKGIHYFDVDGEWFTWMLRHLWIEGSESKAVRLWSAAFPHLSGVEYLKGMFLELVSGKKKFVGSGRKGFEFVEDGTRHWSSIAGGEPSPSWPLLQSWEDVILLKKARLFIKELELRAFRYYRRGPQRYEDAEYNAMKWALGAEENKVENKMLQDVGELWTEIMNFGKSLYLDVKAFMLPIEIKGWSTMSIMSDKERSWIDQTDVGTRLYQKIMEVLEPIEEYFLDRYGTEFIYIDRDWIREFVCNIHPYEEDALIQLGKRRQRTEELISQVEEGASLSPGSLSVDKFVFDRIEFSKKEKPESEDIFETRWTSGYVSPDGDFYGCPDLDHVGFAKDVVEELGLKYKKEKDAQKVLDGLGWLVISMGRFRWDSPLTDEQKDAIGVYMTGKGIRSALFEHRLLSRHMTFEEFMKSTVSYGTERNR